MSTPTNTQFAAAPNGYMIRLELLKMAKDMADQEYFAERATLQTEWEMAASLARDSHQTTLPPSPVWPAFPSPAVIKEKANELYSFITTK